MSHLKITRHGEHVKPHYRPAPGHAQGVVGESTNEMRKDGEFTGVIKRYVKRERASTTPIAMGWIKAAYGDAIEYTAKIQGLRGILLLLALVGASAIFWATSVGTSTMLAFKYRNVFDLPMWLAPPLFVFGGIYLLLKAARYELFCPVDEPAIFDRQHRKVYRVFRETQPGVKGMFKPWPLRAAEYDWDLIDVEHNAALHSNGSTVSRHHVLVFIVKKSATDPTIIDSFTIGNPMVLGEQTVPAMWEHIRRFMEENGPHLPPGETLAPSEAPQTLWQSLGAVGPIGSKYIQWWKDHAAFMILIHALFPFFIPFFVLWGFFNWLSYKTATPIEWPKEVMDLVSS